MKTDAEIADELYEKEVEILEGMGVLKVTKLDDRRFQRFQDIGCIACRQHGEYRQADVHHLLSGGRRRGHEFTIPLCPYHHRNVGVGIGPSLACGSKPFHEAFGSDEELLARTNRLLAAADRLLGAA